jgi:hypothetical protein
LSPDGQTARFLYTILKQLDLKTIDWNLVADGLDITNGHAARMRFSRFKQHMEGMPTQARNPKPKKDGGKNKDAKEKRIKRGLEENIKPEDIKGLDDVNDEANVKSEPGFRIKDELRMIEESIRSDEPPAVRVKREPVGNGIPSAASSRPDYLALRGQGQELLPAANLAFVPPAAMTTQANASIAPPPMATVSLADLHLSPNFASQASCFERAAPNFLFTAKPGTSWARGDVAVTGIKSEPGLMDSAIQDAGCQPLLKSEPTD